MTPDVIVKKIKETKWDNRVSRPGFLQSKVIIEEAEILPIKLTNGVTLKYENQMWVMNHCLYDEFVTQTFVNKFDQAFSEDKNWPLVIIREFEELSVKKDELVGKLLGFGANKSKFNKDEIVSLFGDYRDLLMSIQKYYVVAVPLTSYCENKLINNGIDPMPFAFSYKKFDIDFEGVSIKSIQLAKGAERKLLTEEHLKKYAWIKTGYNLINSYTEKDVSEELSKEVYVSNHLQEIPSKSAELITGLQVGIYLRTRMKEMSQQLWFAVEDLGIHMAKTIGVTRDDFYQLLFQEAVESYNAERCLVSSTEIQNRHEGFIAGYINGEFVLLVGESALELNKYFDGDTQGDVKEIRGKIACKGVVRGKVKVILSKDDFFKFEQDEILVASSTTPDYILLMKKASAIITNEGGLSSHAAIVSRELRVPCIIGTKIATKVLKDGDLVEVDADNGIVKVIKRG